MRVDHLEDEIVAGIRPPEDPADALHMCHVVAAARLSRGEDFDVTAMREHVLIQNTTHQARVLYGAGLVLCPIFEPVKHRDYQAYTRRMSIVRLEYAGIRTDHDIQQQFRDRVRLALDSKAFESLEAARASRLWELLERTSKSPVSAS
jgi:hypothetical protein